MNNSEKTPVANIIDLVFKALALAMAVAATVTSILGVMEFQAQIIMIGFGLFALTVTLLGKE